MSQPPVNVGELGLGLWHIGTNAAIVTDEARLILLRDAMDGARTILGFEDRYAMVIDNLMDFERHLFDWTLHEMHRHMEDEEISAYKRDANRLLGSLLTSCRQYIDQTQKHMKAILTDTAVDAKACFSEQYDAHLSYRVMEAMRNYVQHEDLGVHTIQMDARWLDEGDNEMRRYVVTVGIDLDHLSKASSFKAATLKELVALPVLPDLKRVIREYISALGVAHKKLRDAAAPKVKVWRSALENAFADVQTAYPSEELHALAVFRQSEPRKRDKLLDVWMGPMNRVRSMERFNETTLNLGPAYASTEPLPTKPKKK